MKVLNRGKRRVVEGGKAETLQGLRIKKGEMRLAEMKRGSV